MMTVCDLCFHQCHLSEGQIGFCRARQNVKGRIISLNYGLLTSIAMDPIEKKPFVRFHPGSWILSVGSFGCNFHCPFCQNHSISQADLTHASTRRISPQALVDMALEARTQGNIGIAYTYNEPLITFEYVYDCAVLAKSKGLLNVLVTNGTISTPYLMKLLPMIDALNIDLKGFTQSFYSKLGGNLEAVKACIEIANESSHVEITTLIIPGENDQDEDMEAQCAWLASINPDIPLHLTRFFPNYLWLDHPMTPIETLERLARIACRHLTTVAIGNV